jgi:hypothetical protein
MGAPDDSRKALPKSARRAQLGVRQFKAKVLDEPSPHDRIGLQVRQSSSSGSRPPRS